MYSASPEVRLGDTWRWRSLFPSSLLKTVDARLPSVLVPCALPWAVRVSSSPSNSAALSRWNPPSIRAVAMLNARGVVNRLVWWLCDVHAATRGIFGAYFDSIRIAEEISSAAGNVRNLAKISSSTTGILARWPIFPLLRTHWHLV